MSEKARERQTEEETEEERTSGLRAPLKFWTVFGAVTCISTTIVALVLFIVYSL